MKTTPQSMKEEFNNLSVESPEKMLKQLWFIVKLSKYVRLRARNNAAFNNLFNQVFDFARFEQVTKTRADGSTYPGLKITLKSNPNINVNEEEGEE